MGCGTDTVVQRELRSGEHWRARQECEGLAKSISTYAIEKIIMDKGSGLPPLG